MSPDYFREGGPFNAQRIDSDHISWQVPIGLDEFGRVARMCPRETCSPGYFKVKIGTGITEEQPVAYCPYCRWEEEPASFLSAEQLRYMRDVALHEATLAFQNAMKGACRGSKAVSFKPGRLPHPRQPFEDTVQRDVVCPHCGLDHAVFGLATWCPDCGRDIMMTHIEAEYAVVHTMLSDVERRGETFGPRITARDLENCLEDVVSIFEAVLKAFLVRHLRQKSEPEEDIQKLLDERIRNGFQNPERAAEIVRNRMSLELFEGIDPRLVKGLKTTFEKRHPITHNLGVVDRKYIERALQDESEGRDVRVTKGEILQAIEVCLSTLTSLHARLFLSPNTLTDGSSGEDSESQE